MVISGNKTHRLPRQTGTLPIMDTLFPNPWPIIVFYGLGVDSTALLIDLKNCGIRPTTILFSDVGNEKRSNYA